MARDDRPGIDHVEVTADALEERFWGRTAGWVGRTHDPLDNPDSDDDIDRDAATIPSGIAVRRRLRDSEAVARLNDRFGLDSIDPLITRIGVIVLAALIALPIVWATRDVDGEAVVEAAAPTEESAPVDSATSGRAVTLPAPAPTVAVPVDPVPTSPPAPTTTAPLAAVAIQATEVAPDPASVVPPPTTLPPCGSTYTVRPGDSWSLVADRASIRMRDLLAVNGANSSSRLYPDGEICLPVGARVVIPTTTAPRRATQSAPATTAPAATTTVPLPPAPSRADAEAIVREVWPDDLEERALEIVHRESRFNANAQNWCCVGLFQIHWNAHKRWLAGMGITDRRQLFDARTNASAAYALYQRNGWSPWDL